MVYSTTELATDVASIKKLLISNSEVKTSNTLSTCEKSRLGIQTTLDVFNYLINCTHNSVLSNKTFAQCSTTKIISLLKQLSSDREYYFSGKLNLVSLELVTSISNLVQNATFASNPAFIDSKFVSDYVYCMQDLSCMLLAG